MPDDSRTSTRPRRVLALAAAATLVASAAAAFMLSAASSASGADVAPSALQQPSAGGAGSGPPQASLAALFGLPGNIEYVDQKAIGAAARFSQTAAFFEALAALPPPAPPEAPAPVEATALAGQAAAPAPVERAAAAPPSPVEQAAAPVAPPPPSPPPPPPPPPPIGVGLDTSAMNAQEQALFDATNARRASQGLPALRPNQNIVGVARIRSQDMATNNYFAHESPVTGDTAFSLMDAYGISYGWAGENLAMNNYPAGECASVADQALWGSPPHRENMLNANYTEMGIGFRVGADGMCYFTIIFQGPA